MEFQRATFILNHFFFNVCFPVYASAGVCAGQIAFIFLQMNRFKIMNGYRFLFFKFASSDKSLHGDRGHGHSFRVAVWSELVCETSLLPIALSYALFLLFIFCLIYSSTLLKKQITVRCEWMSLFKWDYLAANLGSTPSAPLKLHVISFKCQIGIYFMSLPMCVE